MDTEKPFFIVIVNILKIFITIYIIYLVGITIFNMSLKEVTGEIISIHHFEKEYYSSRENRQKTIYGKDIYYKYNVNMISYSGKRISNYLIYPNFDFILNEKIKVYYSTYFPQYSVLFNGNVLYIIYNIIPIILLEIIIYIIKQKYNILEKEHNFKRDDFEDNEFHKTEENTLIEMEDIFIEEVGNGEKTLDFLQITRGADIMVIESLFKAEQIPYKIQFHSVKIKSYRNCIFQILEKDYDDALLIIEGYIKKKSKIEREGIIIYKKQYGA